MFLLTMSLGFLFIALLTSKDGDQRKQEDESVMNFFWHYSDASNPMVEVLLSENILSASFNQKGDYDDKT